MIDELVGHAIGGIVRLAWEFLIEPATEISVRGVGYCICRPFSDKVEIDDGVSLAAGLLFWIVAAMLGYLFHHHQHPAAAIVP